MVMDSMEEDYTGLGFGGSDQNVVVLTDYGLRVSQDPNMWPSQMDSGDGGVTFRVLVQLAKATGNSAGHPVPLEVLSYGRYPLNPMHVDTAIGRLEDLGMVQRAEMGQVGG